MRQTHHSLLIQILAGLRQELAGLGLKSEALVLVHLLFYVLSSFSCPQDGCNADGGP